MVGEGVLFGGYSLTRIEPVSPLAACARERAPSRSLATRDAACDDTLTSLQRLSTVRASNALAPMFSLADAELRSARSRA